MKSPKVFTFMALSAVISVNGDACRGNEKQLDVASEADAVRRRLNQHGAKVTTVGVPGRFVVGSRPSFLVTLDRNWSPQHMAALNNDYVTGLSIEEDLHLTSEQLSSLGSFRHVRILKIKYSRNWQKHKLDFVGSMPRLWSLTIAGGDFRDADFERLPSMTDLENLALIETAVTEKSGKKLIAEYKSLRVLKVHGSRVNTPISTFVPSTLEALSLKGLQLGVEDAEYLAKISSLKILVIDEQTEEVKLRRILAKNKNLQIIQR